MRWKKSVSLIVLFAYVLTVFGERYLFALEKTGRPFFLRPPANSAISWKNITEAWLLKRELRDLGIGEKFLAGKNVAALREGEKNIEKLKYLALKLEVMRNMWISENHKYFVKDEITKRILKEILKKIERRDGIVSPFGFEIYSDESEEIVGHTERAQHFIAKAIEILGRITAKPLYIDRTKDIFKGLKSANWPKKFEAFKDEVGELNQFMDRCGGSWKTMAFVDFRKAGRILCFKVATECNPFNLFLDEKYRLGIILKELGMAAEEINLIYPEFGDYLKKNVTKNDVFSPQGDEPEKYGRHEQLFGGVKKYFPKEKIRWALESL
ncbi:MAG: hypothetical protein ABII74_07570 [Elusimicrobiota bacterium]